MGVIFFMGEATRAKLGFSLQDLLVSAEWGVYSSPHTVSLKHYVVFPPKILLRSSVSKPWSRRWEESGEKCLNSNWVPAPPCRITRPTRSNRTSTSSSLLSPLFRCVFHSRCSSPLDGGPLLPRLVQLFSSCRFHLWLFPDVSLRLCSWAPRWGWGVQNDTNMFFFPPRYKGLFHLNQGCCADCKAHWGIVIWL